MMTCDSWHDSGSSSSSRSSSSSCCSINIIIVNHKTFNVFRFRCLPFFLKLETQRKENIKSFIFESKVLDKISTCGWQITGLTSHQGGYFFGQDKMEPSVNLLLKLSSILFVVTDSFLLEIIIYMRMIDGGNKLVFGKKVKFWSWHWER